MIVLGCNGFSRVSEVFAEHFGSVGTEKHYLLGHDAGASLLVDGKLVAAVEEERLNGSSTTPRTCGDHRPGRRTTLPEAPGGPSPGPGPVRQMTPGAEYALSPRTRFGVVRGRRSDRARCRARRRVCGWPVLTLYRRHVFWS
ncbi:hypothetical protein [Streptomyces virginiae]|uniref:hypothetical protein n=1 Tax=Streptomyces virginiae TaxID=1961 RepID=UPI00224F551D|nr:hypothetical protein [Streptomyces virginiae]MCX5175134.1 hypothetical protein [Streptomyces virginiae]